MGRTKRTEGMERTKGMEETEAAENRETPERTEAPERKTRTEKDPAVLFYTSDFLAGVSLMTMRERGQFITLLCLQRERGHLSEKEVRKAVGGKLSPEVRGKLQTDENGLLYNPRMERETERRKDFCQRQRSKALTSVKKREKKDSGGSGGISRGSAGAEPIGNGNGNCGSSSGNLFFSSQENLLETGDRGPGEGGALKPTPDEAAVLDFFLDRVNSAPSTQCTAELLGFLRTLGPEATKDAITRALDENISGWSYIRGILLRYQREGLTSLAAVERHERERDAQRAERMKAKEARAYGPGYGGTAGGAAGEASGTGGALDKWEQWAAGLGLGGDPSLPGDGLEGGEAEKT